jgi:hypothetical protein
LLPAPAEGPLWGLRLAPVPDPVYRAVVEHRDVRLKPFHRRRPVVEIGVTVRRLAGPSVRDAATGPERRGRPRNRRTASAD